MARSLGLYAIVSLQSEPAAGLAASANRCPLPDAGALAAWNELASMFGNDPGVMFELYNEPGLGATAAGWSEWLNGGTVVYGSQIGDSCTAVGMQQLINQIRTDGAGNVIVVPALGGETNLAGMPALTDPTDPSDPQLAYGIHYPNLTTGITAWDKAFGNFSAKAPVIVTEWDGAGITPGCTANSPAQSEELLAYLASKRIAAGRLRVRSAGNDRPGLHVRADDLRQLSVRRAGRPGPDPVRRLAAEARQRPRRRSTASTARPRGSSPGAAPRAFCRHRRAPRSCCSTPRSPT